MKEINKLRSFLKATCLSYYCLIFGENCIKWNQKAPFFIKRGKNPPASPVIVSFLGKNCIEWNQMAHFLWKRVKIHLPLLILSHFLEKLYVIKWDGPFFIKEGKNPLKIHLPLFSSPRATLARTWLCRATINPASLLLTWDSILIYIMNIIEVLIFFQVSS